MQILYPDRRSLDRLSGSSRVDLGPVANKLELTAYTQKNERTLDNFFSYPRADRHDRHATWNYTTSTRWADSSILRAHSAEARH